MLPLQFFGQNLHFAISLLAAIVFFGVFWLYFDAWVSKKPKPNKEVFKWAGFLLVSLSLLAQATVVESSEASRPILGNAPILLATLLRLVGYGGIVIGLLIDPLQKKPQTKSLEEELGDSANKKNTPVISGAAGAFGLIYALPVGALAIAGLYWRRATTGLERHLRPVAIAFILLFGFELLSLASLWRDTDNPSLYNLVKAYGSLWIAAHVLLLAGAVVLGRWVWQYLTERFQSQLFMIFTAMVLVIFLLTTVSFTYLLMNNVQKSSLDNLSTAANVLDYALDSKKAEAKAEASAVAQNPRVISAIEAKDHKSLASVTSTFLQDNKQSSLVITTDSAQVLLRAENPDHWGDSISSDSLTRRALVGLASSTIVTSDGVLAPVVSIKAAVPVRDGNNIIGSVSSGVVVDNAFVDGIKNSTGLDSAVYSGDTLSATTFVAADGKTRQIGVKQTNKTVTNRVLTKAQVFKGSLDLFNRSFLTVYSPLKDSNNNVVGMIFIGQPQADELQTADRSINLTFVVAVILLMMSIIPAFLVARQIARQLE